MAGDERVDEPMFMMIASRNLKNWGPASALVKKSAKLPTVETNGTRKEWFSTHSRARRSDDAQRVSCACGARGCTRRRWRPYCRRADREDQARRAK